MKIQVTLSALLVAQLALALGLFRTDGNAGDLNAPRAFVEVDVSTVDKLAIADGDSESTLLRQGGAGWRLPALANLPANGAQVEKLLESLAGQELGYPLATTAGAARRFEVAEDKFQRRLRLYRGDEMLGEYYFGSSPGFRQTHARRGGDNEIHALAINNFDLHAEDQDWLDKTLLSLRDPQAISGADFELRKAEAGWQLSAAGEIASGEGLEQEAIDDLVNALASLRVLGVAGQEPEGEADSALTVVGDDESWTYSFYSDAEDTRYLVRRNDRDSVFTLSRALYERLAGKGHKDFLPVPVAEPPEGEAASGET